MKVSFRKFISFHSRTLIALVTAFLFSATVVWAFPYTPADNILDPACGPTDPTCYVSNTATGVTLPTTTLSSSDVKGSILYDGTDIYIKAGTEDTNYKSLTKANEVDVFLVAGQSNARGRGDSTLSPHPESGTAYSYYNGQIAEAIDPVGPADTGSAWPAFAIEYYKLTGRKIAFIPFGMGGSAMAAAADDGQDGDWDAGGEWYGPSVQAVHDALAAFSSNGYVPEFRGILWAQGEADGNAIRATPPTISINDYKAAFEAMITRYQTDLGSNTSLYIFRTARGYTDIQDAQEQVATEMNNVHMVFRNAADFQSRGLLQGDSTHYTQPGYNEMGRIGAEAVVSGRYDDNGKDQSSKTGFGGITRPAFSVDVKDQIGINGRQVLYLPDETAFDGTLILGGNSDGVVHLSNTPTTTEGQGNTLLGISAGVGMTSGNFNTASGYIAFRFNTTGSSNTANGYRGLYQNTTGSSNVGIGRDALNKNTTGSNNVAIGREAGLGGTGGSDVSNNTFLGYRAGFGILTGGSNNVLVGYQAGDNLTTGTGNVLLGYNIDVPTATSTNTLTISNMIFGTGLSGTSTTIPTTGKIGIGLSSPTAILHLKAGTATANTAPLKFNSGVNLTSPEDGAMEYDGTHVYFTVGSTRYQLDQQSTGTSLPSQTGNNGKYLTTDGTTASWGAIVGSSGGTVTSVVGGTGLGGGTITVSGTLTNNLSTGVSGGQSVIGGTGSGDSLTLVSTSHSTKGKIIFGASGTSAYDGALGFLGVGTASPAALLHLSGTVSAAAWSTSGIALRTDAATYQDTSTLSGATVGVVAVNALGTPTLSSNTTNVTYTNASTLYIAGPPTNGAGVNAITNPYSLYLAGGNAMFGGGLQTGTSNTGANFLVNGAATGQGISAASTQSQFRTILPGPSTVASMRYRSYFYGSTSTTLGTGNSYASILVANAPVTAASSGTHDLLANVIIRPLGTITNATPVTITNTASLYIEGAASGGTNNYALWTGSGTVLFNGASGDTTVVKISTTSGNTCSFSTSTGSFSCASDARLKHDIVSMGGVNTLPMVTALNPVTFRYNWQNENDAPIPGFIAQEFEQIFPDLVTTDPITGYKSLSYAPLVPYTVEAIKEMDLNVTRIDDVTRPNTWRDALLAWFGNAQNGIQKLFTHEVTTDTLCVGTNDNHTCITKDQLDNLLQHSNTNQQTQPPVVHDQPSDSSDTTDDASDDTTTPTDETPQDEPIEHVDVPTDTSSDTSETPPTDSSSDSTTNTTQ
jgi:hypothetical protein